MARQITASFTRAALVLFMLTFASPAGAWDTELLRAIMQVHLGTATEAQLALVRANNHVINNMASTGHMTDRVYQKLQADFTRFNAQVAAESLKRTGSTSSRRRPRKHPHPAPTATSSRRARQARWN